MKKVNPFNIDTISFRAWANGKTRMVSLKHKQRVEFKNFRHTDEGWHEDRVSFFRYNNWVYKNTISHGRDCDGYHSYTTESTAVVPPDFTRYGSKIRKLDFILQDDEVYDQYASMMGY